MNNITLIDYGSILEILNPLILHSRDDQKLKNPTIKNSIMLESEIKQVQQPKIKSEKLLSIFEISKIKLTKIAFQKKSTPQYT